MNSSDRIQLKIYGGNLKIKTVSEKVQSTKEDL